MPAENRPAKLYCAPVAYNQHNKEYLRGRAHNRYLPNEMVHVGTSITPSYPPGLGILPRPGGSLNLPNTPI